MNLLRPTPNRRFNELVGLLLFAVTTLLLLALVSYHPVDPSADTAGLAARPANWVGPVGAYTADLLFQALGVACFLFVVAGAMLAWRWFRAPDRTPLRVSHGVGLGLGILACSTLLAELPRHAHWRGATPLEGALGAICAAGLLAALNPVGAYIVSATTGLVALFLATSFSFGGARGWLGETAWPRIAAAWTKLNAPLAAWRARRSQQVAERKLVTRPTVQRAETPVKFIPAKQRQPEPETAAARARRSLEATETPATASAPEAVEVKFVTPVEHKPVPARALRMASGGFTIPPITLLQEPSPASRVEEAELREMAARLTAKCQEFTVGGAVTQINPGPVVTTYEFKPEAGVKYNRVTALNDDLCLALEAESIYIERIPGKSTVGIEVPNRQRETILLREIIASEKFLHSKSPLTMALGKDINGEIVVADLAAMPHLLIAGSTGSGKSVALNSMIVSLLFKSTPDQVKLILVDPKRLELGLYDGIPHLYTPIITEPKLAAFALRNATREMERRLKLLAGRGVRNIAQYNRLFEERPPGLFDNLAPEPDARPLPYIVIVIDELADLMIVDASNVEESITRLAQMARAVGIHLILATQRPSVDVITGLIKANFPARMSFRVATRVDSRTILDAQGAELLLGKGDMLFLPPGTSRFHRVHGAFVTEKEIGGVVANWAGQGQPEFDEDFLKPPPEAEGASLAVAGDGSTGDEAEAGDANDDPLFEDAVRVICEYGKASTSLLQRRLRIGYGRAAHLIDLMYADGIVGPADGPKPRELLKRPDWITEVEEVLR